MKVYGVVHLKSLPGSPSNRLSIDEIIDAAQEDVNSLVYGGVDGIIIENFGDTPFVKNGNTFSIFEFKVKIEIRIWL